jgi:hypothetical protein
MSGTSTNYSYWKSLPAITIWEAACIYSGHDPRAMTDVVGADGFALDLSDEVRLIESTIYALAIRTVPGHTGPISKNTHIDRQSFAQWLTQSAVTREIGERLVSADSPTTAPESASQDPLGSNFADQPPGQIPRTAASRLAILAAWELECETNRPASVNEVFNRLVAWSQEGKYLETLRPYDAEKREIPWVTTKGVQKSFGKEACKNALFRWNNTRRA